jgi:hypothetical protein
VSSQLEWPEDEPLVADSNMNDLRDELAHALFHALVCKSNLKILLL